MLRNPGILCLCILLMFVSCAYAASSKTKIAYIQGSYIYICGEDGSSPSKISTKGVYSSLIWSPDGKKLSCVNKERELCIFYVDSSKFVVEKNAQSMGSIPEWSPDSKSLISGFAIFDENKENDKPQMSISIYNTETKQKKLVVKSNKIHFPAPTFISNHKIAYVDDDKSAIVVLDLNTKKSRSLSDRKLLDISRLISRRQPIHLRTPHSRLRLRTR